MERRRKKNKYENIAKLTLLKYEPEWVGNSKTNKWKKNKENIVLSVMKQIKWTINHETQRLFYFFLLEE